MFLYRHVQGEESIFKMLATPENTLLLCTQYRMNSEIMNLANRLMYDNKMICHRSNRKKILDLRGPKTHYMDSNFNSSPGMWAKYLLSLELIHSVLWLDTSALGAWETRKDDSIMNKKEVEIVLQCVRVLKTVIHGRHKSFPLNRISELVLIQYP